MTIDLNKLEKIINLKFKNQKILKQSLTHKSYNTLESNEKLEFLGDRVLGLVISKKLLEKFPKEKASLSFETPNYKVQFGKYKFKIIGIKKLDTIKKYFPSAFLLKKVL